MRYKSFVRSDEERSYYNLLQEFNEREAVRAFSPYHEYLYIYLDIYISMRREKIEKLAIVVLELHASGSGLV